MRLLDDLIITLPDGRVQDIQVGAFWTAVVVEVEGQFRCGLASTLRNDIRHHYGGEPAVRDASGLAEKSGRALAELARSCHPIEAAIGMATINALLPKKEKLWVDRNAEDVIAQHGAGKWVALVGHFPFVSRIRERVGILSVLEQRPHGRDLPAESANRVIPRADVVALTGTTLLNHTFEGLINLCRPETLVLVLGPSTPLSPVMFDYGVHLLSGSVVEKIEPVLQMVSQGANFRQIHQAGVRLVTIEKDKIRN